jgi:hypothetical protein
MGIIRTMMQLFAERVAQRAARDDLFEKPGDRPRTKPLEAAGDRAGSTNDKGELK